MPITVSVSDERVGIVGSGLRVMDAVQRVVLDVQLDRVVVAGFVPLRDGELDALPRWHAVRDLTARERQIDADRDRVNCAACGLSGRSL